jgi:predicted transcriptional regulator
MLDLTTVKKHRVILADYPYQRDVASRLLMAGFSTTDVAVVEEILFSPLKTSVDTIAKSLDLKEGAVSASLAKLQPLGLFTLEHGQIIIDKEVRRYVEVEMGRFDPDFKPDIEYVSSLLKKVPIHVLPIWYAIPRTSTDIFESILEKYLATPQIFQRHLLDLNFPDPTLSAIAQDVLRSPGLELKVSDLRAKYNLSQEQMTNDLLFLELHFVCYLAYRKVDDHWIEVAVPLQEWRDYLSFLRTTEAAPLPNADAVIRTYAGDFAFIQEMAVLLQAAKKQPTAIKPHVLSQRAAEKLVVLDLAEVKQGKLSCKEGAKDWLDLRLENRALALYRHPKNRTHPHLLIAEKSILRVLHAGWVVFEDFLRGVVVPLHEGAAITLRRQGRHWHYVLPTYSAEELQFLHKIIFEHLFEIGVTAVGMYQGKECFMVTPFGQSLFGYG